jgi:hypothetical protein
MIYSTIAYDHAVEDDAPNYLRYLPSENIWRPMGALPARIGYPLRGISVENLPLEKAAHDC